VNSRPNDHSPVTQLQSTVSVFRLNYAFRLIVEGLVVCTVSGFFLYELPFRRYKAFKSPTLFYFQNFDDFTNTVARCFSLY